ncbi:hypothetical protein BC938DRAFT_473063 [Jimgerdemannia flammicorona]|uniref:START domain-containing protein n=1 Tax=Jimgerdemannia flammicorona TaxID=994334 RepID=A0A433Q4P9_9FUNG|nr:hypothetical protein BC938DRAFT_473063 [Jimgerdemannia flammicorona]
MLANASPRDVVAINTTYATQNTVQIFTTSTADASLSRSFPGPEATGYVRAQVDIAGWHLESPLPTSVHITYLVQSDPKGWIPAYVLTTMATQAPAVLGNMIEFLEKHGAPPNLIDLYNGRVNSVLYDHEKGSWRLEYVPYAEGPFARNPPEPPAVEKKVDGPVAAEGKGKGKKDNGSAKESSPKNSQGSSSSLSSTVLTAEIRLDARKWSGNGDYEVVVDPPPSRVTVTKGRAIDPFGLWMRITHEQEGVSPLGGKVLVMVRRSSVSGWGVAVNGIQTPVVEEEWVPAPPVATRQAEEDGKKPKKLTAESVRAKMKDSAKVKLRDSEKIEIGSNESLFLPKLPVPTAAARPAKEEPAITPNTPIDVVLRKLGTPPVQQALSALALLRRLDDQQYGWTFVSDKAGLQVSKRVVPPDIPEYLSLVKAVKVIERFSLEEVAAVVTNSGCRRAWDDMLDDREVLKYLGNGCAVIRSGLKAWFPLKSRDLFTASCTARASADSSTNSQSSRFFYVETSINDYPHLVPPTDPTAKPRGRLYLSGWILEAVDPYTTTTNHPIPSTRVTFMASLDMGGSIPGTVSSLVTLGMPKAIQQVETYLKSNGAPPYLTLPPQLIELKDSDLADDSEGPAPAQRFEDVYYELPKASSGVGYRNVVNSKFNRHAREFKVGLEFDLKPMCVLDGEMSGVSTTAGPSSVGGVRDAREVRMLTPSTSTSTKTKPISTLIMERRGSAPGRISTNDLPNGDGSKAIKSNGVVDGAGDDQDGKVVLEIIVDLKRYPQGYEILTEVSPLELNGSIGVVSSPPSTSTSSSSLSKRPSLSTQALSVKVVNIPPAKSHTSSLSPSSSQFKHSIHVSAHPSVLRRLVRHRQASLQTVPEMEFHPLKGECSRLSSMDLAENGARADVVDEQDGERFVLDFLLLPLQERKKPSKLTKRGVLGDEKDEWNGVVVVNGEEVQVEAAKGLSEKELAAQREKSNNAEDHGGVVAKARRRK